MATTRRLPRCACSPTLVALTVCAVASLVFLIAIILATRPHDGPSACAYQPEVTNANTEASPALAVDVSESYALADFLACEPASDKQCARTARGIAFSGGGWKALAMHMGVARATYDLDLKLPPVVSANSGGGWFLALLAFSSRFFKAVQTKTDRESIGEVYGQFMEAYRGLGRLREYLDPEQEAEQIDDGEFKSAVRHLDTLLVIKGQDSSWRTFIESMLDAYQPGMGSIRATRPTNGLLAMSSLSWMMALAPDSFLDADAGQPASSLGFARATVFYTSNASKPRAAASIPFTYESNSDGSTGFWAPLVDGGKAVHRLERTFYNSRVGERRPLSDGFPKTPMPLGLICPASSAAAGLVASPTLTAQALNFGRCNDRKSAVSLSSKLWPLFGLQNLAPCTSGKPSTCAFPGARLLDGGYADNSAVISALAQLQRLHPAAESYRLLASFANSCYGSNLETMGVCNDWDNSVRAREAQAALRSEAPQPRARRRASLRRPPPTPDPVPPSPPTPRTRARCRSSACSPTCQSRPRAPNTRTLPRRSTSTWRRARRARAP
jgi:hypothetical protein